MSAALMKRPLSRYAWRTGQTSIPTGGFTDDDRRRCANATLRGEPRTKHRHGGKQEHDHEPQEPRHAEYQHVKRQPDADGERDGYEQTGNERDQGRGDDNHKPIQGGDGVELALGSTADGY